MASLLDLAHSSSITLTGINLLLDLLFKGLVILIAASALTVMLRRASAAARHMVWSLAVTSLLALPLLCSCLPDWQVPLLPQAWRSPAPAKLSDIDAVAASEIKLDQPEAHRVKKSATIEMKTTRPTDALSTSTNALPNELAARMQRTPVGSRPAPLSLPDWILIVWAAGMAAVFTRLLVGTTSVWWMARRAKQITENSWASLARNIALRLDLPRAVKLLKSERVTMPLTYGVLQPVVLLPADADHWSADKRQVVLLHELAHVKRRDCLWQILAQMACALYWFNPLIWVAYHQLRMERERACDDHVLNTGTKASDYASHLLDIARSLKSAKFSSSAAVAIAHQSQLECRLVAILNPNISRRGLNRMAAVFVWIALASIILPLAALRPTVRAAALARSTSAEIIHEASERQIISGPDLLSSAMPKKEKVEEGEQKHEPGAKPQATRTDQKDETEVVEALKESAKDTDIEIRLDALTVLAQAGGNNVSETLKEALNDARWEIREKAAWGLGVRGDSRSVEPLIIALRDSSPQVREKAAWSLGLKGDKRAVEPLITALRDEDSSVREKAAWALGLKGDSRAIEPLIAALKDDSYQVREHAAWALGLKGDRRAMKPLNAAMKDENRQVRQKASWAVGMLLIRRSEDIGEMDDLDVDFDFETDDSPARPADGKQK